MLDYLIIVLYASIGTMDAGTYIIPKASEKACIQHRTLAENSFGRAQIKRPTDTLCVRAVNKQHAQAIFNHFMFNGEKPYEQSL